MQLHRDRSKFDAAGVRLAVIGQGTPAHAQHFRETQEVDLPMYVDEARDSYKAAGTKIATGAELIGPRMVAKGASVGRRDGVHQGRIIGHAAQLGGVMVVRPGNEIVYVHLADDAGDNPPNEEVLEAAKAASKA
ncbi:MAG TPA: AhpC/TSA family protein [Thermoleophilaceae bacterium]|nr:AhpC/TSA family protein [Thermoleophilaceae bacterium]